MSPLLAVTLTAALAVPAAPPVAPPEPLLAQAVRLSIEPLTRPARPAQASGRDSLENGARIGAVVGGVAFGGFVGLFCLAAEDIEGNCVNGALLAGAIGAVAGAAIGAGVDALFDRPMAAIRMRFWQ